MLGRGPYGSKPLGATLTPGAASDLTASATGSQVAAESGAPQLLCAVPVTGAQGAVESGTAALLVGVPATGSEVLADSGTAVAELGTTPPEPPGGGAGFLPWPAPRETRRPVVVAGTGAEGRTESGRPRLVFALVPRGGEVTAASDVAPLGWVDNEAALLAVAALVD